ncbi:hypothetical protein HHK36_031324 [Tetracentron sinense]|uniref:Uncharacterized protein n=1 Tax=Tetracentron sinense TaxID=13715 RepID=A0A835CZJ9_TETSI|nr:hypothetical protein HHK36_031324 [Tetracentron sinense]
MAVQVDDIGLLTIVQHVDLDVEEDEETIASVIVVVEDAEKQQHHHLRSIASALVIRQIPSQGISFQLWPAATSFLTLLDHNTSCTPLTPFLSKSQRILELGSGTGLVGIAAAATLGAYVTLTDLPHVLPNLQFNADANAHALAFNCGTVHVASLRWGEAEDMESVGREFDLLLASDVVYHDHLFDPLLQTVHFFLSGDNSPVFLMAHLKRWKKKDSVFFKKARKMFHVEMIHSDPPSPGSRVGVAFYLFTRKCGNGKLTSQTMPVP